MQGNLYMNNYEIKSLKDPINNQDAGTKKYIDAEISKLPKPDYYDNTSLKFELPIDMKNKDITGVNKITTDNLDVKSQIDMKGNKITGVCDGSSNNDAVNKIQLDAKVSTVNNKITQINKSLNDILTKLTYFYFTDQLIHKNHNTVIFPSSLNKPPFRSVRGKSCFIH